MANRSEASKIRLLLCNTNRNDSVQENKISETCWAVSDEGSDQSPSNDSRHFGSKQSTQKSSVLLNQDKMSTRRLLPSDTSADSSVREHKKSEKWWEVLDEGSYPTPSNDLRYECSLSPKNSKSKHSMRNSRSFMSPRTSSSGFSCSDFSLESREKSRIIPLKKRKKVLVSPAQYDIAISNEISVVSERTMHKSLDPNVSSFKVETSVDDFSRIEQTENINPLVNRRPERKFENRNSFSRVLSDMTHLVSHTSITDTVYEHIDKNSSGGVSICDIYESKKYEAPATATYCRQTVERNGATTTYVTISEVKERVHVQNRSCRVPNRKHNSPFEFSEPVNDLTYGSECMYVQHIISPKMQSSRHNYSGTEKKERKLEDTNGLEILIETQNPLESISDVEVEDISDILNRSGPIEKKKFRCGRGNSESKSLLAICASEFEEILDEQPHIRDKNQDSHPGKPNHDVNQTSSFSMSESLERSGGKKSGRKLKKQSQNANFSKELRERSLDRSDSCSFNVSSEHGIPDYPYFAPKMQSSRHTLSGTEKKERKLEDTNGLEILMENKNPLESTSDAEVEDISDILNLSGPVEEKKLRCGRGNSESKSLLAICTSEFEEILDEQPHIRDKSQDSHPGKPNHDVNQTSSFSMSESLERSGGKKSGRKLKKRSQNANFSKELRERTLDRSDSCSFNVSAEHGIPDYPYFANKRKRGQMEKNISINSSMFANAFDLESEFSSHCSPNKNNSSDSGSCYNAEANTSKRSRRSLGFSNMMVTDKVEVSESDSVKIRPKHSSHENISFKSNSIEIPDLQGSPAFQKRERKRLLPISSNAFADALNSDMALDENGSQNSGDDHLTKSIEKSNSSKGNFSEEEDVINFLLCEDNVHSQMACQTSGKKVLNSGRKSSRSSNSLHSIRSLEMDNKQNSSILRRKGRSSIEKSIDANQFVEALDSDTKSRCSSHKYSSKHSAEEEHSFKIDTRDKTVGKEESLSLNEISSFEIDDTHINPLFQKKHRKKIAPLQCSSDLVQVLDSATTCEKIISQELRQKHVEEQHDRNSTSRESLFNHSNGAKVSLDESANCKITSPENKLYLGKRGENDGECKSVRTENLVMQESPIIRRRTGNKSTLCINSSEFAGVLNSDEKSSGHSSLPMSIKDPDSSEKVRPSKDSEVSQRKIKLRSAGKDDRVSLDEVISLDLDKNQSVNEISLVSDVDSTNMSPCIHSKRRMKNVVHIDLNTFTDAITHSTGHTLCSNNRNLSLNKNQPVDNNETNGLGDVDVHDEKMKEVTKTDSVVDGKAYKNGIIENKATSKGGTINDSENMANSIPRKHEEKDTFPSLLGNVMDSGAKSEKLRSSRVTMNNESLSFGENSSINNQSEPVFRRIKGKKAALPINSSAFVGIFESDLESDSSIPKYPSEAMVGNEEEHPGENVKSINEENSLRERKAEKQRLTEDCLSNKSASLDNKHFQDQGETNPIIREIDGERKKRTSEIVCSVIQSNNYNSIKDSVNDESMLIGDNSSDKKQFHSQQDRKTSVFQQDGDRKLPTNVSDFSENVMSHQQSNLSSVVCPTEDTLGSRDAPSSEKAKAAIETISILDNKTEEIVLTDGLPASKSSTVSCNKNKKNPNLGENEGERREEKIDEVLCSYTKPNKSSSSKSAIHDGSPSIGENSSISKQNIPIFQRKRGKKAGLPISSCVFDGILMSDSGSDCSRAVCPSEDTLGSRDAPSSEKDVIENISILDNKAKEIVLTESFPTSKSSTVSCNKDEKNPHLGENEEERREEKIDEVLCSYTKPNKSSSSKSAIHDGSPSIGENSSLSKQNIPIFQRKRGTKAGLPISSCVFDGILMSDSGSDCSRAVCPSEDTLGSRDAPSSEKDAIENISILGNKAKEIVLTESLPTSKSCTVSCNNDEKNPNLGANEGERREEKIDEVLCSYSKPCKSSSSKSVIHDESPSIGENSSISKQNIPIFQRKRGKKAGMPISSSVFDGILTSDSGSDCSSYVCASEDTLGSRAASSGEKAKADIENISILDNKAGEIVLTESLPTSKSITVSCNKNKKNLHLGENEGERKGENFHEVVGFDSKSKICPFSKSTINYDNDSAGGRSSMNTQAIPIFHRNNEKKKTVLPINASVFAQALGSDSESDSSSAVCPHEVLVERKEDSLMEGNISGKTVTVLNRNSKNVISEDQVNNKGVGIVSCNENNANLIPRKDAEEKRDLATKGNKADVDLESDRRTKRSDSLIDDIIGENLPVNEKSYIDNPNVPVFHRNRGMKAPLPINSSVFAGVLETASFSESVAVEKEDDSLLPDSELYNINPDGGYFESTRGFIIPDAKSPFSRISKNFGDLSCILKEPFTEKNSLEGEDGDVAISKKDICAPTSMKSIVLNGEVEDVMHKSADAESYEPMGCLSNHSKMHKISKCSLSHDSDPKLPLNEIKCQSLRKYDLADSCFEQSLKLGSVGDESILSPVPSPTYQKGADIPITRELIANPTVGDGSKHDGQVLENVNEVLAVTRPSHSASLEQKEIEASSGIVLLPQKEDGKHLSGQVSNTKVLGNGAIETVASSSIVPLLLNEEKAFSDELLLHPSEVISLPKEASTSRNLRQSSVTNEAIQPSPVVSSPKKNGFSSIKEPLPKQSEVTQLPRPGRNVRSGGKAVTAIPVPIVSMRERKGASESIRSKLPSEALKASDAKQSLESSSSVSGALPLVKRNTSAIGLKSHIVTGDKYVASCVTSLAHTSPLSIADKEVAMDIPSKDLSSEIAAINDVTFVKSTTTVEEGSCINNLTFTIADGSSERGILLPSSASEINNLTFIKSNSAFDPVALTPVPEESVSAISPLGCGHIKTLVVPQEEIKKTILSYQVLDAQQEVSTPISQHKVGDPQAVLEHDLSSEKLVQIIPVPENSVSASGCDPVNSLVVPQEEIKSMVSLNQVAGSQSESSTPVSQLTVEVPQVFLEKDLTSEKLVSITPIPEESTAAVLIPVCDPVSSVVIPQEETDIKLSNPDVQSEVSTPNSHHKVGVLQAVLEKDLSSEKLVQIIPVPENSVSASGCDPVNSLVVPQEEIKSMVSLNQVAGSQSESSTPVSQLTVEVPQVFLEKDLTSEKLVSITPIPEESTAAVLIPVCDPVSSVVIPQEETDIKLSNLDVQSEVPTPNSHHKVGVLQAVLEKDLTLQKLVKITPKSVSSRTEIVEKVCSMGQNSDKMNEPRKPGPSNSQKTHFKCTDQTFDSDLLMLSPLNFKLISSESSGPSTSSSAVFSGQFTENEFSVNAALTSTKLKESVAFFDTKDLTPSLNLQNSGPGSCAKEVESCNGDSSFTYTSVTAKDLSPSLNKQSSGPIFSVEQSEELHSEAFSNNGTLSNLKQHTVTSSVKEDLVESIGSRRLWITSHGEESGPVAMASTVEGSMSYLYKRLTRNHSLSSTTVQVSGPIHNVEISNDAKSVESSGEDTVSHPGERLARESHKREILMRSSRSKTSLVSSHDEESEQSCSSQTTDESTASQLKHVKKGFDSVSSTKEDNVGKIVDNVLRKLDEACAQQRQRDLEQAQQTVEQFKSLFPTKLNPDKKKKLKSCARGQVPNLRKRRDPNVQAVEKCRRLPAWCSKTLKKLMVEAMEEMEMPYLDQEEFLFDFADTVKQVIKSKDAEEVKDGVLNVQKRLFDLKIVWSLSDFFEFVRNYLPREFRYRSIPCSGWDDPIYATRVDNSHLNKPLF